MVDSKDKFRKALKDRGHHPKIWPPHDGGCETEVERDVGDLYISLYNQDCSSVSILEGGHLSVNEG